MIEIRIHGRGGQGAVIASKALAQAVFMEGKYVQSFPEFGVERRGAPVRAFTRIDEERVLIRSYIYRPDHIMVLDPTLIEAVNVTLGMKKGGWILINSDLPPSHYHFTGYKVATVDATNIAVRHRLGSKTAPIVNTAILGAFAKITGIVKLESIEAGIKAIVPLKQDENAQAAREAYDKVIVEGKEG